MTGATRGSGLLLQRCLRKGLFQEPRLEQPVEVIRTADQRLGQIGRSSRDLDQHTQRGRDVEQKLKQGWEVADRLAEAVQMHHSQIGVRRGPQLFKEARGQAGQQFPQVRRLSQLTQNLIGFGRIRKAELLQKREGAFPAHPGIRKVLLSTHGGILPTARLHCRSSRAARCRSRGQIREDAGAISRHPLHALACTRSTCRSRPW